MTKFVCVLYSSLLILVLLPSKLFADLSPVITQNVVISEVKIDGSGSNEYVEIYNFSDNSIDLDGWKVEYAKPGFDKLNCGIIGWANFLNGFETVIPAQSLEQGAKTKISRSMTDSLGGSIRIIDTFGNVHDLVGWDNGTSAAPCLDDQINRSTAPWANDNQSIQRYLDCETNIPVDTNDSGQDFLLSSTPGQFINNCPVEEPDPEIPPSDQEPSSSCGGIILSEILPNPAGSDTGQEFIELFNNTQSSIDLLGCQLQTSANSKIYAFGNEQLAPSEYKAFFDNKTSLTLPNSAGGSVYLIDTDQTEIDQIDYPANLEDDQAWAKFDSGWDQTYLPSPDAPNQLLSVKPCPAGQIRNEETNRCVNELTANSSLAACKPGQERNPESKRCRNIASLASILKACDPGQVRNPETNRCKKVGSDSLAACKENQERNPETNRCRNIAGVLSGNDVNHVNDITAPVASPSWIVAVVGLAGAVFYAVWEWRNELFLKILTVKNAIVTA